MATAGGGPGGVGGGGRRSGVSGRRGGIDGPDRPLLGPQQSAAQAAAEQAIRQARRAERRAERAGRGVNNNKLQRMLETLRRQQDQNRTAAMRVQNSAGGQLRQTNQVLGGQLRGDLRSTANQGPITMDNLSTNPAYGAIKTAIERQFDSARNRAFEDTASGGALTGALGGIEAGRAGAQAQGFGGLAIEEANRQERTRQNAVQNALGGLGQFGNQFGISSGAREAATQGGRGVVDSMINLRGGDLNRDLQREAIQAGLLQQQSASEDAKKGGLGSGIGSIAGAAIKK